MKRIDEFKIKDRETYLKLMRKGMEDKLFFVDSLPINEIDTFLDYGCADGSLLKSLSYLFPKKKFIGYDCCPEMIEEAKVDAHGCFFSAHWHGLDFDPSRTCLILSSVIHEVYSYGDEEDIERFWKRALSFGFKYIVIRDMMYCDEDILSSEDIEKIRKKKEFEEKLKRFEKENGSIDDSKQALHFLLKYGYDKNWEREVRENYLPIGIAELEKRIKKDYKKIFFQTECLPFLKERIREDFEIDFDMRTHMKIILKKKT